MRLTKSEKSVIVNRILNDIPSNDAIQRAQKLYQDYAFKQMPAEVKMIYNNPQTRAYLNIEYKHFSGCESVAVYCEKNSPIFRSDIVDANLVEAVGEMRKEHLEHLGKIRKIRCDLDLSFSKITTTLQFRKKFPEFAKYITEAKVEVIDKNLPIANNIITDLKQLGWKNGK